VREDAAAADRDRANGTRSLVSETRAQSVWKRAAELQAYTSSQPAPALPELAVRTPRTLSESSAYKLSDVRASAVDAGIPEVFVQQALAEHGLVPTSASGAAASHAPVVRRGGVLPAVLVKDGSKQLVNPLLGTATRLVVEAIIDGEMPERDYDLVLDIIRREIGEVGQIGSVGRTFSWSVSNQNRKLQISVMPRGGKTTVRIDEQLGNIAGGVFGGIMGGIGGGLGGAVMGGVTANTHAPLLGLAGWVSVIAAAYAGARFTLRRIAKNRQEKLREIASQLANQIAESIGADK